MRFALLSALTAGCASAAAPAAPEPYLAFTRWDGESYEVHMVDPKGGDAVRVDDAPGVTWVYASYDGDLITVAKAPDAEGPSYHLYAFDPETRTARQLTDLTVYDSWLGRSPDGSRYVMTGRVDGAIDLYLVDATTGAYKRLTNDKFKNTDPDWSPDGQTILFRSDRGGTSDLWLLDVESGDMRQITDDPDDHMATAKGYAGVGPGRFSPDGSKIVWMQHNGATDFDVCVMDADGANKRCLTDNPGSDSYPAWSPDGSMIAYYSTVDGDSDIWVMNADGSDKRRITSGPDEDYAPVWVKPKS